ncbi:hypothetical protein SAMN05216466_101353 [Paraburkholderia phenazinium]|uniref:Uncharacterized protein n=2 Tax=Paraburkholderia phenazinium TaxID=60549 RepID=A0A1G7PL28_9BURK|nr:hypothetical protein SAMN05216466_101353 [Paraburkholderia phenazinium]
MSWNAEKLDFRVRIDEQAGKYSVFAQRQANAPWEPLSGGSFEAAPASQFKEIAGTPYLSRESGAVPDGVRPSKDVPLKTLVVPETGVFLLMPSDWFQRNKLSDVSYNSDVIALFTANYGGTAKPVLLCRV